MKKHFKILRSFLCLYDFRMNISVSLKQRKSGVYQQLSVMMPIVAVYCFCKVGILNGLCSEIKALPLRLYQRK